MSTGDVKSTKMGEETDKDEMLDYGRAVSEEETENKVHGDFKDSRRKTTNRITIDVTEIIEGKREKKTVQRLDFQVAKPKEKLKIEDGGGDKLGDIARSNHHIGRMKAPDLKPLHKILFDRPGAVATMRKNMRLFNGFPFEVDSDLYIKKQKMLLKLTNTKLRTICKVLDLESGGLQSVRVERILTFLMAPKITGKPVVSKKKKKSKKKISTKDSKGKTKAKAKSASSSPRKAKAESKSKAIVTDSSSDDDEDEEEEEEEDKPGVELEGLEAERKGGKAAKKRELTSDEDTDNSDEEEEELKSKSAAKGKATAQKSTPVKQRAMKKAAPLKKMKEEISESGSDSDQDDDDDEKDNESEVQKPKKKQATKRVAPTKSTAKTKKADSSSNRQKKTSKRVDDSSDDDVPLIKMIKKPPTDEQLKETLKGMLKDANLEEMTMKQICQKVYDTYPEYDLTSRKDLIKQTVKMLIS